MKSKYLLLIATVITLCLSACKKEGKTNSNPIVGKWYESKLVIHSSNGTAVDHDTTFTSASFTKDDNFQFTSDMKAVFSQSGIYSTTGKSIAISGGTTAVGLAHYNYSIANGQLKLTSTDYYPTTAIVDPNYQLEDIVLLDATQLILRTTYYAGEPLSLTTTAYFTKGK